MKQLTNLTDLINQYIPALTPYVHLSQDGDITLDFPGYLFRTRLLLARDDSYSCELTCVYVKSKTTFPSADSFTWTHLSWEWEALDSKTLKSVIYTLRELSWVVEWIEANYDEVWRRVYPELVALGFKDRGNMFELQDGVMRVRVWAPEGIADMYPEDDSNILMWAVTVTSLGADSDSGVEYYREFANVTNLFEDFFR